MVFMPRLVDTQERHTAVYRAVVHLATSEGFAAVTIRAVAAQLRASTTVVTHYFPTRDAAIAATLRHELGRFDQTIDSMLRGRRGAGAIRALVSSAVFDGPEDLRAFWMASVIEASREPVIRAELARFDTAWDARLADLVAHLDREQGSKRAGRADQIDLLVSGAIMLAAEGVDETTLRRTTESLLDLILKAGPR